MAPPNGLGGFHAILDLVGQEGSSAAMSASYQLALVHHGHDEFATEIRRHVRQRCAVVLGSDRLLNIRDGVPDAALGSHVVVAYLASLRGAQHANVAVEIEQAMRSGFPILPIVRKSDPGSTARKLSAEIAHLNAVDWEEDRSFAVATILQWLGLTEDERRIFLSYVRRDSAPVAEQLHGRLQERQFDVFLDRFSVPPGIDFQQRLSEDLADKAFMLLIESDGIRDSGWVQYEISYALSHRISVMAITPPNIAQERLAPIDEAFRYRLLESDMQDGRIKEDCLHKLFERIETAHAGALRRRRDQLLGSLIANLRSDGCTCEPLDNWAIVATAPKRRPSVYLVTPRRPRTEDLRTLDMIHGQAEATRGVSGIGACLAHDVEHMADHYGDLLNWVASPRGLGIERLDNCQLQDAS